MSVLIPGDNLDKETNCLWNQMFWQDVRLPDSCWSTFVFLFALLTTHKLQQNFNSGLLERQRLSGLVIMGCYSLFVEEYRYILIIVEHNWVNNLF